MSGTSPKKTGTEVIMTTTVNRTKKITRLAIFAALILVGLLLDTLITFGTPVKIAAVTLCVLIPLCIISSLPEAIYCGTVFGILSLLRAFIMPNIIEGLTLVTADNFLRTFANPLVSVVPRIMIGVVVNLSSKALRKTFSKSNKEFVRNNLSTIISGVLGVITNTGLVFLALLGMNAITSSDFEFIKFIAGFFTLFMAIEIVVVVTVVPFVVAGINRAKGAGATEMEIESGKIKE